MKNEFFNTKNIDKEVEEAVDSSITQIDELRLGELKELKKFQELKQEILKNEHTRIAAKHAKDDPRVLDIEHVLAYNIHMFDALDKEIEKAKIVKAPFASGAWRIHGRVFDSKANAVKGVTVFLSENEKNWFKELGNAGTDEMGYYSMTVDAKIVPKFKSKTFHLVVTGKKKEELYFGEEPIRIEAGLIDYNDIHLIAKGHIEPPEPPIIKNTAPAGDQEPGTA